MVLLAQRDACARVARTTAGFTMTELLMTTIILTLAGIIVATGMPVAARAYRATVDKANAQVLLSTAASMLRNKLDKASDVTLEVPTAEVGPVKSFVDGQTGYRTKLVYGTAAAGDAYKVNGAASQGLIVVVVDSSGAPLKASGGTVMEGAITPLVDSVTSSASRGNASKGLTIDCDEITFDTRTGIFTVSGLKVLRDGETVETLADITIRQMNESDRQ